MPDREVERIAEDAVNHHQAIDAVAFKYGSDGKWAGAVLDSEGVRLAYVTGPSLAFVAGFIDSLNLSTQEDVGDDPR